MAPYRAQVPKVVTMIRGRGEDGAYAYSSDDYVDLAIQPTEKRAKEAVAPLKNHVTEGKLAELACVKQ